MKDMPTEQPVGLILDTYLPREDVRDAFVSLTKNSMDALEAGQKLGSSSLRRKAQLMLARPDLEVVEFRGNVQTRLKKLEDGVADATFLAAAGLNRLGLSHIAKSFLDPDVMLPAVAQGPLGSNGAAMTHASPKYCQLYMTLRQVIVGGRTGVFAGPRRILRNPHCGAC